MTTAHRHPPRKERGLTMIELVITVAIAIILASVAIPSFRSFIAGQRIKTVSFDLVAMLTLTRSEAIKRNVQVTSTPTNNDWAQGWVVTAPLGTTTVTVSQQSGTPAGSITITCLQGATPQACAAIVYNSSGRATQAQSIQIVSAGDGTGQNTRCITIDLSGRPMSKKGTC